MLKVANPKFGSLRVASWVSPAGLVKGTGVSGAVELRAGRLSSLGGRNEDGGTWRLVFRSFEENSGDYLTKRTGKVDPCGTTAVDQT